MIVKAWRMVRIKIVRKIGEIVQEETVIYSTRSVQHISVCMCCWALTSACVCQVESDTSESL